MTLDVVVLTKSPLAGRVKTRLAADIGVHEATTLHTAMVWETLTRARRSGAHVRVSLAGALNGAFASELRAANFPVEAQASGDLGRKLSHALRHSGRQLALGTDCVVFEPGWLASAASVHEPACLGPTDDGGYWAVGGATESEALRALLFNRMVWSAPTVAQETERRLSAAGIPMRLLPRSYDIDTLADLQRLAADPLCPARIHECLQAINVPSQH